MIESEGCHIFARMLAAQIYGIEAEVAPMIVLAMVKVLQQLLPLSGYPRNSSLINSKSPFVIAAA